MASVVWASRLIEPNDMAPVEKRLTISLAGSTSSSGTGLLLHLLGSLDAEHAAERQKLLGLLVDLLGVGPVFLRQRAAHGMLQVGDHARAPHVRLAANAEGVLAADFERIAQHRSVGESEPVALDCLTGDFLKPHAFNLAVGAGEIFGDELGAQANGVEDLGAAIGLIGGDAHLGHHLEQALVDRLDVALDRLFRRQLLVDFRQHGLERLKGDVGVDRLGAVTRERCELMHLMRLAGLHDETHRGPKPQRIR